VTSALMVFLGVAAGVLAGLFGIGGGVIMVLGLAAFFKLPFPVATGTSLAAMLLPVEALGVWVYWKNGNVDFRAAALLAAGLFVGSWIGAKMANDFAPAAVHARSPCSWWSWRSACGSLRGERL
jgi:uncharacterized membrane protein YfcA